MNKIFSPLEISAIGEVTNISLGSSATAISNMLDHRVDITTPTVSVVNAEEFELGEIEPAIGVEIKYVTGLEGSNIMILKMSDIKVIVDILMGTETPDEEFVLNDLTLSAVCEVMNQMMGAASTALSDFLGRVVNISTPETFDLDDMEAFRKERLPAPEGPIVVVKFALDIEPDLKSEFMNVMSVELAKELVAGFGLEEEDPTPAPAPEPAAPAASGGKLPQEEIEKLMSGAAAPAPAPAPEPAAAGGKLSQEEIEKLMAGAAAPAPAPAPEPAAAGGKLSQEEIEKLMAQQSAPQQAAAALGAAPQMGQMPGMAAQMPGTMPQMGQMPADMSQMPYPYYYMPPYGWYPPPQPPEQPQHQPPEPKVINTQAPTMPTLANGETLGEEQAQNLDLIMGVPLEVTVEIGRTRKKVQDILAFSKGSLVVLDKLAGDQVDLFVNGKCIARGEVVVIDDNFGIRISEILHKPELEDIASFK